MTAVPGEADRSLNELRQVLFRDEHAEVARLREEVRSLHTRIRFLESLLMEPTDRAEAVGCLLYTSDAADE